MDPEPLERLPLAEFHRIRSSLAPWRHHSSVASLDRALATPA
jgi:hypothetical protein